MIIPRIKLSNVIFFSNMLWDNLSFFRCKYTTFFLLLLPNTWKNQEMGKLFVVPTPVGNLEDMTFRAIRILKEADLILAEDTRTSGILLKHFEIKNSMISHHKFNEHKMASIIKERILAGLNVALISDAGTNY